MFVSAFNCYIKGAILTKSTQAIFKLINEINTDIIKTIGIDIRLTRTPFIKKECKFISTRLLFFVAAAILLQVKSLS
jgi:hypothetical protein